MDGETSEHRMSGLSQIDGRDSNDTVFTVSGACDKPVACSTRDGIPDQVPGVSRCIPCVHTIDSDVSSAETGPLPDSACQDDTKHGSVVTPTMRLAVVIKTLLPCIKGDAAHKLCKSLKTTARPEKIHHKFELLLVQTQNLDYDEYMSEPRMVRDVDIRESSLAFKEAWRLWRCTDVDTIQKHFKPQAPAVPHISKAQYKNCLKSVSRLDYRELKNLQSRIDKSIPNESDMDRKRREHLLEQVKKSLQDKHW